MCVCGGGLVGDVVDICVNAYVSLVNRQCRKYLWWYCKIYKRRCTSEYKRTYDLHAINSSLGVTNILTL
jgi:hypothetical protein